MESLVQTPTDPAFVQDPYPFYELARQGGHMFDWTGYMGPSVLSHAGVMMCFKDRRLGREPLEPIVPPDHLTGFYGVEANSMLEIERPRHTRLRKLVLHAFTSRAIGALEPGIRALCHELIDGFPSGPFDLLEHYARPLPVRVIARLLGVPEADAPRLLSWSSAMVAMYQAGRTRADEVTAETATREFSRYLSDVIAHKRRRPDDDLISTLIAAEEEGQRLTGDELIATLILLLNAGHEATVHTLGNGIKALVAAGKPPVTEQTVEEVLRYDPPLHIFQRWVYEDMDLFGYPLRRGDQIALLLAAANRDPAVWDAPDRFEADRPVRQVASFGAGIHFCVGAPLARLEIEIGLRTLFERCQGLEIIETPRYADIYHFHGLERLIVRL